MTAKLKLSSNYDVGVIMDYFPTLEKGDSSVTLEDGYVVFSHLVQHDVDAVLTRYKKDHLIDHRRRTLVSLKKTVAKVLRSEKDWLAPIYQMKYDDAKKYIDDGSPTDLAPYKWLRAEIAATGGVARTTALIIIAAREAWEQRLVEIEEIRRLSKVKITATNDIDEMDSLYEGALEALSGYRVIE